MAFPTIAEIIRFFESVLESVENFALDIADGVVRDALEKFSSDIEILQDTLDLAAEALPEPDEGLKAHVCTAYDVALALRDYQQKELRSFLTKRYKQLLKDFKQIYSTRVLITAVKQLVSLEFGAALGFILNHLGALIISAGTAELLYKSLNEELGAKLIQKQLQQRNPRRSEDGPHRTRKPK